MTEDRITTLFFELFSGLPRQGPGDTASTLRALSSIPGIGPETRVLDLGCGTGLQTRLLARHSPARILAIDTHAPYIDELNAEARRLGVADRLEARVGDMRAPGVAPGSVDVIWCEGAAYVIGFEAALRDWRRLLARGGHIALTEACWSKPDPPPELTAFWDREYPAIRPIADRLTSIRACGYDIVTHFALPPSAWWDDYYRPLQANIVAFRERHRDSPDAQAIADGVQREIDIWHAYSEYYSYAFFVMRA